MIIFDTNAVRSINPESSKADLLRMIVAADVDKVGVPWMVLEELAAHRAVTYRQAWKAAESALSKLRRSQPWDLRVGLGEERSEELLDHWRYEYSNLFTVIPSTESSLREALIREANRIKPAKDSERKEGARDAAIWLSIVDFLGANPNETVYFVTENTKDFGDEVGNLPTPMDSDIEGMSDRLVMFRTFDEVISKFTKKVQDPSAGQVEELLQRADSRNAVGVYAAHLRLRSSLAPPRLATPLSQALDASVPPIGWVVWMTDPEVELLDFSEIAAHQIASQTWYTATVRWLCGGAVRLAAVPSWESAVFTLRTRVLVSTAENKGLTILDQPQPYPLDHTERAIWLTKVADLADRVNHSISAANLPPQSSVYPASASSVPASGWAFSLSRHAYSNESPYYSNDRPDLFYQSAVPFSQPAPIDIESWGQGEPDDPNEELRGI